MRDLFGSFSTNPVFLYERLQRRAEATLQAPGRLIHPFFRDRAWKHDQLVALACRKCLQDDRFDCAQDASDDSYTAGSSS
jgi:hypothetical protein